MHNPLACSALAAALLLGAVQLADCGGVVEGPAGQGGGNAVGGAGGTGGKGGTGGQGGLGGSLPKGGAGGGTAGKGGTTGAGGSSVACNVSADSGDPCAECMDAKCCPEQVACLDDISPEACPEVWNCAVECYNQPSASFKQCLDGCSSSNAPALALYNCLYNVHCGSVCQ